MRIINLYMMIFIFKSDLKERREVAPKEEQHNHEENSQYPFSNMHFVYVFLHGNRYSQPISLRYSG